jgi:hypothetical protein
MKYLPHFNFGCRLLNSLMAAWHSFWTFYPEFQRLKAKMEKYFHPLFTCHYHKSEC